jgi:hypoxanthine phosphoribosyltransferase
MPDLQKAWAFLEESELVAGADEIESAVQHLAGEIRRKLGESYPLVLAVMGGAVVFAGQILPRLRFPLDFDYIHATRVSPPPEIEGRAVLVLDDILDGGDTMAAIREKLLGLGAKSFHCAVLVEKKLKIEKPIRPDFVGLQVADRFVFGCGMDAKGFWRNLPEIRAMKGT